MKPKQFATVLYGLAVIAAGIWRHLQTGSSPQAVWFALVMGLLAFGGALLLSLRNRIPGYLLICVSLCFVGGWFLHRLLSGHADGTSVRVILILVVCAVEIGALLFAPQWSVRIISPTMRSGSSKKLLLFGMAVLGACCVLAAVLVLRPRGGESVVNGGTRPGVSGARLRELLRRLPETTGLLLATDDLGKLAGELDAGPAGKLLREESVARFVAALREEPPGSTATFVQGVKLAIAAARPTGKEAAVLVWALQSQRGPGMGMLVRVGGEDASACLSRLEPLLAPSGAKVRQLSAAAGIILKTVAPEGREGTSWGSCGEWVAVSRNIAGCRELLKLAGQPRAEAPRRVAEALSVTGDGRLVGFMEAGKIVPPALAGQLGLKKAEWFAYVASPIKAGRWAERLVLNGKPSKGGLLSALEAGGKRPMLRTLPASTLLAVSGNISDGVRFWRGIESIAELLGGRSTVTYLRGMIEIASGVEFEKGVAARFKGELTFAGLRSRGAAYPQALVGAGLTAGSAKPVAATMAKALAIAEGEVKSGQYRGVPFHWLVNSRLETPLLPSPSYCTKGDRLIASTSSVHLKELIAGRGGTWLSAEDAERLSRGMLSVRVSLDRAMPYILGEIKGRGLLRHLGEKARASLPMQEELADHLDRVDLVLTRCPQGVSAELWSPLPVGALVTWTLLAGE
jgi:hypothetical protein